MKKLTADNSNNDKLLRELVSLGSNRQCFDCFEKGVTYTNMTIGSFACTKCSGILRGLNPPHRVKSISMAKFTDEEIQFLRMHGNDECSKTWLGLWDPKRRLPKQDHKDFMIDKYEKKRFYLEHSSPLKSINIPSSQPTSNSRHANSIENLETTPKSTNKSNGTNGHQKIINEPTTQNQNQFNCISNTFQNDRSFAKSFDFDHNNAFKSNVDMNANFADFENNKIYSAADITKQLNIFNGGRQEVNNKNIMNMNTNSAGLMMNNFKTTSTCDKYAALKDLDEQFKEAKQVKEVPTHTPDDVNGNFNPFKNPFQQQQQQTQKPFSNWNSFVEPSDASNDFGSSNNDFNFVSQSSNDFDDNFFFGNPFKASEPTMMTKNPFL